MDEDPATKVKKVRKKPVRFSLEERKRIQEMLNLDYTIGRIATTLGRNFSTIKYEIMRSPVSSGYTAEKAQMTLNFSGDDGRKLRDENILELDEKGYSHYKIAELLNVSRSTVQWVLSKYYKEKSVIYLKAQYHNSEEFIDLKNKVEILEMQIETISEFLKQLQNQG